MSVTGIPEHRQAHFHRFFSEVEKFTYFTDVKHKISRILGQILKPATLPDLADLKLFHILLRFLVGSLLFHLLFCSSTRRTLALIKKQHLHHPPAPKGITLILLSTIQAFQVHTCKLWTNPTHAEVNKKLPINYKGNLVRLRGHTSIHPASFEINQGGEGNFKQ